MDRYMWRLFWLWLGPITLGMLTTMWFIASL